MAAPKRLTRQQAQQETRARLIDAALNLIAEAGVGAASIRGICERAGFSQGAFYSNFASKDDLLLALVATHMTRIARDLGVGRRKLERHFNADLGIPPADASIRIRLAQARMLLST